MDDPPHAPPHELPPEVEITGRAVTSSPRASGTGVVKRRPIRGVTDRGTAVGLIVVGAPLSDDAYVSPIYPDGLPSREFSAQPPDYQAAAALHWFEINFEPLQALEQLRFSDGTPAFFEDGTPIILGPPASESSGNVSDEGNPLVELSTEFGGLIADELLRQLGEGFLARSPLWQFIPLSGALPIELDAQSQSSVELRAAVVARDAQTLNDHLATAPSAPPEYGQNYWPGAELLDEVQDLRNEVRNLKVLVAAQPAGTLPVEKAVSQLATARSKIGGWLTESYVKAFGTAAGNATVLAIVGGLGAGAWRWWNTLYHLVTVLFQSALAWLAALGG